MIINDFAPTLSLDGIWDFSLAGSEWSTIQVPSCWEAQGYAKVVEGPGLYRRTFNAPAEWAEQRVFLEFDAVSYACTIRVNREEIASHRGMWTPFAVDVTEALRLGAQNELEVEVYKPGHTYPLRSVLAGFLPDVATVFGGIWQPVRLRVLTAGLDDLLIDAYATSGQVRVRCRPVTYGPILADTLQVSIEQQGVTVAKQAFEIHDQHMVDVELVTPEAVSWQPEDPVCYRVRVQLRQGDDLLAEAYEDVGFRSLHTSGERLLLNGEPVCLRGILHWGWEPDRIAPIFHAGQLRDEFRRLKSLGFNLIKLCLFIPEPIFYQIANEEGMLLWQEWPLWLPEMTEQLRQQAPGEYAEYMRLTRCHPSVVLYSLGCELGEEIDGSLLSQLNETVRELSTGVLVCDNSGSSEAYGGVPIDLSDFYDYHTYTDLHHFEPALDNWRRDWREARPWIFGEFCDSDGFRDLDELIAAHNGEKPWWMTGDNPVHTWRPEARALIQGQELLAQAKLGFSLQALTHISNAQSLTIRKYMLEAVRRRAAMGGYVVTGMRDTPISTSGVFDDLGRAKWSEAEFRPFNDDAVLCIDVERRRRWQHGMDRVDRLDVHNWWAGHMARFHVILNNAGKALPPDQSLSWQLTDLAGRVEQSGQIPLPGNLPLGLPVEAGVLSIQLPSPSQAAQYRLLLSIDMDGRSIANSWPIWVYPKAGNWPTGTVLWDPGYLLDQEWRDVGLRLTDRPATLPDLVVATSFSAWVFDYLREGGRALLIQQGDGPLPARRSSFWRESIKLFYAHPVWQEFPHQGYADLQFFGLATDVLFDTAKLAGAVPEMGEIRPLLRRLDAREFYVSDHLLEIQVGRGTLLACSLRLQGGDGAQPTGLQRNVAGHHLLWTMLRYLRNGAAG
jgi:hypothetical protein